MTHEEIFEKQVSDFFRSFLLPLGYAENTAEIRKGSFYQKAELKSFFSFKLKIKVYITLYWFQDGTLSFQFILRKLEEGKYADKKFFDLETYIAEQGIQGFPNKCAPNENFEEFARSYFENVRKAFETYLRDQITGGNFIEQDPSGGYR